MTEPTKLVEELDALFADVQPVPHLDWNLNRRDTKLYRAFVEAWPQLRGMAADAERYRWLRDNLQIVAGKGYSRIMGKHIDGVFDELSAAIDAALAAGEAVSDLLPCPFCGGTNLRGDPNGSSKYKGTPWNIRCYDCTAHLHGTKKADAIEKWNRRAHSARAGALDEAASRRLVEKCVAVLQRHCPPDGISDKDALSELYGLLDGPEYRALPRAEAERAVPKGERIYMDSPLTEQDRQALLASGTAPSAPATGAVSVPREPTQAMLMAGNSASYPSADNVRQFGESQTERIYKAMLAASPSEGGRES